MHARFPIVQCPSFLSRYCMVPIFTSPSHCNHDYPHFQIATISQSLPMRSDPLFRFCRYDCFHKTTTTTTVLVFFAKTHHGRDLDLGPSFFQRSRSRQDHTTNHRFHFPRIQIFTRSENSLVAIGIVSSFDLKNKQRFFTVLLYKKRLRLQFLFFQIPHGNCNTITKFGWRVHDIV